MKTDSLRRKLVLPLFAIGALSVLPLAVASGMSQTNRVLAPAAQTSQDWFGDGRDGAMPGNGNLDNANGFAAGIVNSGNAGTTSIIVSDASSITRVRSGDAVLIHQSQGNGAGCWELNWTMEDFVTGTNTYQLKNPMICDYVTAGSKKAQLLRVPQYSTCNVTGTVTPLAAWNGNWGGILALMCRDAFTNTGVLSADASGFRGGQPVKRTNTTGQTAYSGEGIDGPSILTYQANGNAGGGGIQAGGNDYNLTHNGGAGGGNGSVGGVGYGINGYLPQSQGGATSGSADLTNMTFGGGGGGGLNGGDNSADTGGVGGGIIYLSAATIVNNGSITARGGNGVNNGGGNQDGAAGGGGGGSIRFFANKIALGNTSVEAGGGSASSLVHSTVAVGGNGGTGRIRVEYCTSFTGTTSPVAATQQLSCSFLWTVTPTSTATRTATPTATQTPTDTPTATPTFTPTPTGEPPITTTPTPTVPASGDAYESDDTCAEAKSIPPDGSIQKHTFHRAGDEDWIKLQVVSSTNYTLAATEFTGNALVNFTIRPSCNSTPVWSSPPTFNGEVVLPINGRNGFLPGTYWVRITDVNGAGFGDQVGYALSLRAAKAGGAAIIVAGKNGGNIHQNVITQTTDLVYAILLNNGFTKERIFYLDSQSSRDVDGNAVADDIDASATVNNVRTAVRDWARNNVSSGEPLWIYMADHGLPDKFQVNGDGSDDVITPELFNSWLTDLESDGASRNIIVVIDACYSGSFLRSPLSKPGRMLVSSTSATAFAYGRSASAGFVQRMYFSEMLFAGLDQGLSLREAFGRGRDGLTELGFNQFPSLDANGDALINTQADLNAAGNSGLQGALSFGPSPPGLLWNSALDNGSLSVKIQSELPISKAVVEVIRPDAAQPNGEGQVVLADVDRLSMIQSSPNSQNWSGHYSRFNVSGTYRLVAYAWDEEGQATKPSSIEVVITAPQQRIYMPLAIR